MPIRFNPPFRLRPVFSSKIIAPNRIPTGFGTNSESANEPLMGDSFFCGITDNGDFRVCQYASTRRFACAPFLAPKSLRQIGYPWFFGTNSESANEPLMGGSFFCGERGGNRSIGEANLRKGRQPPLTAGSSHRHCRPISMEAGGFECVIGGGEWCNIKCLTMLGIRLNSADFIFRISRVFALCPNL